MNKLMIWLNNEDAVKMARLENAELRRRCRAAGFNPVRLLRNLFPWRRTAVLIWCLGALVVQPAFAGSLTAMIVPNPQQEPEVSGYTIYWGAQPHSYTHTFAATNLTNLITGVALGTNYFAASAKATLGDGTTLESELTDEVPFCVKPGKPLLLILSLQTATDPAGPWRKATNIVATVEVAEQQLSPTQFYRAVVGISYE